jgi:regulatory protein
VETGERDGFREALARAYFWLGQRAHSAHEIRQKLVKAGCEPDVIVQVIEGLRERRLLDDGQLASDSVQVLAGRKGWGREKIRRWLAQRGFEETDAQQALGGLSPEHEEEQVNHLIAQQRARNKKPEQIFRFLLSRGFRADLVRRALLDAADDSEQQDDPFS